MEILNYPTQAGFRDVPRFVRVVVTQIDFKSSTLVIFNFFAQLIPRIPCRHNFLYKAPSIFIHSDILVPVGEFVVVAVLSEWWLVPTTVGTSLRIMIFPVPVLVQEIVPYSYCIRTCHDKYRCQASVGNLTCPFHLCEYWCRSCS